MTIDDTLKSRSAWNRNLNLTNAPRARRCARGLERGDRSTRGDWAVKDVRRQSTYAANAAAGDGADHTEKPDLELINPLSHVISRQDLDVLTFVQCNSRQQFLHLCPFTTSHATSNPPKCPSWSLPCCDRSYRGCAAPWPRSACWCALPRDRKIPQAGGSCQRDETRAELRGERSAGFM